MMKALNGYREVLNRAYGATTHSDDRFGALVSRLVRMGVLICEYATDDEALYSFADGSDLEVVSLGDSHMAIRATVSNGVQAGDNYYSVELGA